MRISLKGQSAIEYLMTYGWMLLVVAVVGGAIFAVAGNQTVESSTGFNSDIVLDQFGMTPFSMQLAFNSLGTQTVEINEITVSSSNTEEIRYPGYGEYGSGSEFTATVPILTPLEDGSSEIDIEILYNIGGLENIGSSGTLTGAWEIDNTIIGYWSLAGETESEIIDSSRSENHGTLNPGNIGSFEDDDAGGNLQAEGLNGPAIEVIDTGSGGGGVFVGENATLTGDQITIGAWAYLENSPSSDARIITRVEDGSRTTSSHDFMIDIGSSRDLGVRLNDGGGGVGDDSLDYTFPEGEWVNIVLTYDGEEAVLYVNGEEEATDSTWSGEVVNEADRYTHIGNDCCVSGDRGDRVWPGKIQDVILVERVLTEDEIQAFAQGSAYQIN